MGLLRDPREGDGSCTSVSDPLHPAMVAISFGKNCSDRECRQSVAGGEATGSKVKRPSMTAKPGIRKVSIRRDIAWGQTTGDVPRDESRYARGNQALHCQLRRLHGVGLVSRKANEVGRCGNSSHGSDRAVETHDPIEALERSGSAEIGLNVTNELGKEPPEPPQDRIH